MPLFEVGMFILVETNTPLFGRVVYRLDEIGVSDENTKTKDGLLFTMIGGSGPSANYGRKIIDTPGRVGLEIQQGKTKIIPAESVEKMIAKFGKKTKKNNVTSTGIQELD